MANPTWFDYNFYLSAKLAQLQSTDPTNWPSTKTTADVETVLTAAGFGGQTGAYNHYLQYGDSELVNPSQYLNVAEYYGAKLAQMQKTDPAYTLDKLLAAFKAAGLTAGQHYDMYGATEGVNPSNAFDDAKYLSEKLVQLQKSDPTNWSGKTVADVQTAFKAAGLSPLDHYIAYGKAEGLTPVAVTNPVDPIKPVNPGTTFTLTTADDTITGTAKDDVVTGVSSALTAEKTLNTGDKIDGAAGNDTLQIDMKNSFSGFTGDGKMVNVENVVLTNSSSIPVSYSATGSTGVTSYTLKSTDAAINLSDLSAAGIAVSVEGLKTGTTTIGFTTDAVKGTSDALTLGLNGVGTAKVGDTAAPVTVNAAGIETVSIKATGDNYLNMSGLTEATAVKVSGTGSLNASTVTNKVTSFDGSAASGKITADLSTSGALTAVKGGSADDTFTVTTLAASTTLEGGAGNDTLVLKGFNGTIRPTMSGFENVTFDGGSTSFVGNNTSDFTGMTVKNSATVTLANVTAPSFAVTTYGSTVTTTGTVTLNDATVLTYNTVASKADNTASEIINAGLKSYKATAATINVGAKTSLTGAVTLDSASSVNLNVASAVDEAKTELTSFNAVLTANKATTLTVKADGALGTATEFVTPNATSIELTTAKVSTAKIDAVKATNVTISADKALDIAVPGTNLSGAQTVVLSQNDGLFKGSDLKALNSLTVSGAGTDSAVALGVLGDGSNTYGVSVKASGLSKGLTFGKVATKADVNFDFTGMTGSVNAAPTVNGANVVVKAAGDNHALKLGTIDASKAVTIDGSERYGDTASMTIDAIKATTDSVTITLSGAAKADFSTIEAKSVTIDASNYLNPVTQGTLTNTFDDITAATTVIKGSGVAANKFNVKEATSATFTGGVDTDSFHVTGTAVGASTPATLTLNVSMDAGNDTLAIDAKGAKLSGTIDGGTGETDTLQINSSIDISAATVKNFEGLDMTHGDATVKLSAAQYKAFTTVTADDASKDNIAFTDAFNGKAAYSAATYQLADVTGNSFDGSEATALQKWTVVGGSKADIIKGGLGDDKITAGTGGATITGGAGADNITLGAGADKVVFAAVADSAVSIAANTTVTFDTVSGFATDADKFNVAAINTVLTGGAEATGVTVTTLTTADGSLHNTKIDSFADLKAVVDAKGLVASAAGAAAADTGLQAYVIDLTGNTGALGTGQYLVINNHDTALTAADVMVQLTGTHTVAATDFVFA